MSQSTGAAPADHAEKSVWKFVRDNEQVADDIRRQAEDDLARAQAALEVQPVSQRYSDQAAQAAAAMAEAAAMVEEARGVWNQDNADDEDRLENPTKGSHAVQSKADYRHHR